MKNNSKTSVKKAALYILGAFSGVLLTLSIQSYAAGSSSSEEALPIRSLRTMAEVYGQIKANYVENKTDDQILEGAMKGMVANLDPHSEYMTAEDYKDLQESTTGEFGGLGMEVGMEDGFVKVVSPIEDTPADRAGVKSGDLIVKIDDESTRGMTVTEAVKKMRGKPGTKITLTLSRKDAAAPIVVHITRAIIKVKSVRYKLLPDGYGYVRITQFQEKTTASLADAVKTMHDENKAPLKGLVLDLRDDPGGLLNSAVGVSAAFLQPGADVVSTKGRDKKEGMKLKALPADYAVSGGSDPLANLPAEIKNIPITVLVNSGTASASEIVSGALQDHKRAVIVGTQSFGKGSVQTVVPLSNGGAAKLTTALYYTPNDRSIQARGITPDVEVVDANRKYESREADLSNHLSNPTGAGEIKGKIADDDAAKAEKTVQRVPAESSKNSKDKEEDSLLSRREPNPEKDAQLKAALELLKNPAKWQSSLGLAAKKPQKPVKSD